MQVEELSNRLPRDVVTWLRSVAAEKGCSLSEVLSELIRRERKRRHLDDAMTAWEQEHGPVTAAERAEARRVFEAQDRARSPLTGDALSVAMRWVGLRLSSSAAPSGNVTASPERILVSAVHEAMRTPGPIDYRLLAVIAQWFDVHGGAIDVGEIGRLAQVLAPLGQDPDLFSAFFSGIAHARRDDARYRALAERFGGGERYLSPLPVELAAASIAKLGEDARFVGSRLRVDAKMLRRRASDVDDADALRARGVIR